MEDDYQPQDLFVLQATDMQLNCFICCRSVTLLDKMGKLMTVFRVLFVAPPGQTQTDRTEECCYCLVAVILIACRLTAGMCKKDSRGFIYQVPGINRNPQATLLNRSFPKDSSSRHPSNSLAFNRFPIEGK